MVRGCLMQTTTATIKLIVVTAHSTKRKILHATTTLNQNYSPVLLTPSPYILSKNERMTVCLVCKNECVCVCVSVNQRKHE